MIKQNYRLYEKKGIEPVQNTGILSKKRSSRFFPVSNRHREVLSLIIMYFYLLIG
jgi:hypothetical protein